MRGVSRRRAFRDAVSAKRASVSTTTLGPLSSIVSGAALYLTREQALAPETFGREELCTENRWPAPCEDVRQPQDKDQHTHQEEARGRRRGEKEPPLTPSQRKRSEEEIILSAPASAQSAKSKESPEKEPKSKKQKRQSEKLKCISSPKPIGI